MEIKHYLELMRRWAWLLALGLVLGLVSGYGFSVAQTPVYQAATKVLVMRAPQERYSDLTYLSDQQLTQTYIQLLATDPVVQGTARRLNLPVDRDQVRVQQVRDTQVIQISVEDINPARAAMIANGLVEVLIDQNELLQAGRYATSEESIQAQINQVESQIGNLESQIDALATQSVQDQTRQVESQIGDLQSEINILEADVANLSDSTSANDRQQLAEKNARLSQLQSIRDLYQEIYTNLVVLGKPSETGVGDRLSRLQTTLDLYQQIYLQLLGNLESIRLARLQNTPNVVQIENASMPSNPVRPRPLTNSMLSGAIGLLLASGAIFLFEYLNDTLRTPEDVELALQLPIIGYIAEMQYPGGSKEELYVARQPRSPVSEAFRSLRTNLEFSSVDRPLRTILVTSARPAEGKTTIATNLAAIFAQAGRNVVLLDADMRRPCVHRFLGVPNRVGLSTLFRDQLSANAVGLTWNQVERLQVITSGSLPPNPAELLGSERMDHILKELSNMADVVIIDSPPSLVADAQLIASRVDGVLFVVQPGETRADEAQATLSQFERAGARVLGVVFNRIPRNRSHYYGGYRYYSPYYSQDNPYYSYSSNGTRSEKRGRKTRRSTRRTHMTISGGKQDTRRSSSSDGSNSNDKS